MAVMEYYNLANYTDREREMISLFEWLHIPQAVIALLFSLPIIFVLSLYFAGKDFGVMKVPEIFDDQNRLTVTFSSIAFLVFVLFASAPLLNRPLENAVRIDALQAEIQEIRIALQASETSLAKYQEENSSLSRRAHQLQYRYESAINQSHNQRLLAEDKRLKEERVLRLFDTITGEPSFGVGPQGIEECGSGQRSGMKFSGINMRCIEYQTDRFRVVNAPIYDFRVLREFENLRSLNLTGTLARDIGGAEKSTRLSLVSLTDTFVSDLTPLSELFELRELYLTSTPVENLTPLSNLKQLESVSLRLTNVTDLIPLSNSRGIRILDLFGTPVQDLEGIRGMETLYSLELSQTGVNSIDVLRTLVGLKSVRLEGTQITDVTPLLGLKELQHVVFPDGSQAGAWNTGARVDISAVKGAIETWGKANLPSSP